MLLHKYFSDAKSKVFCGEYVPKIGNWDKYPWTEIAAEILFSRNVFKHMLCSEHTNTGTEVTKNNLKANPNWAELSFFFVF